MSAGRLSISVALPKLQPYQRTWAESLKASHEVTPLRACALCVHSAGQHSEPELVCNNPEVRIAMHTPARTCLAARAANGPCGPNATHLDMRSWHAHGRPTENAA